MSSPISLLRFGNFSLDLRQRALLYNEDHVSLTPKAFEILLFLVEHRGTVVSKDDLMKHIWGEISVEESNLSKNISFLRKTLANTTRGNGQDKSAGENDKYIVTHSKLGYRFVHPVEEITVTPPKVIRQTTPITSAAIPSEQANSTASAMAKVEVANDFLSKPVLSNPESFPVPRPSNSRVRVYLGGLAAVGLLALAALFFWFKLRKDSSDFDLTKLETKAIASWKTGLGSDLLSVQASPDGNFIAFSKSESAQSDIYVQQIASTEARPITEDEWPDLSPIWSPDNQKIAYLSARPNYFEVWVTPLFGGKGEKIHSFDDAYVRLLNWSKDGTKIYYVTLRNVLVLDLKTRQSIPLTKFDESAPIRRNFTPSPDEKSVAYVETVNKSAHIFIAPLDGSTPKQVTSDGEINVYPTWFPNGKQILYSSKRGDSYQLCVAFLDGRPPIQLIPFNENGQPLHISLDGRKIFYATLTGEADVYRLDLVTGSERQFTSDALLEVLPEVSPLGKNIVFHRAASEGQVLEGLIWTRGTDAKNAANKQLAKGFDARWAPNSERLTFLRTIGSLSNLLMMRSDGADQRQLTQKLLVTNGFNPNLCDWAQPHNYSWSPKGDLLAFSAIDEKVINIWTVPADGGAEIMISNNNDPRLQLLSPIWSPDGKRLAYLAQTSRLKGIPRSVLMNERDAAGGREQTLLQTDLRIRMVGWAAGGTKFLAGLVAPEMPGAIVDMELVQLTPGQQETGPIAKLPSVYFNSVRLSPDAKTVAFVARQDKCDNIWQVSLDDRRLRKLTNNKDSQMRYAGLAWSPDQKSLFFSKQSATTKIWKMENFR